jgi:transcription initiation factor IIE alpha subunit
MESDDASYIDFLNCLALAPNGMFYDQIIKKGFNIEDEQIFDFLFPLYNENLDIINVRKFEKLTELVFDYWGLNNSQDVNKIKLLNTPTHYKKLERMIKSLISQQRKDLALLTYEIISQHSDHDSIIHPMIAGKCLIVLFNQNKMQK